MPTGPGLEVTSGIGTISGVAAVNSLPVTLYGASGDVITDFSGALNVNISGGSISVNVSGQNVNVSGQPVQATSGGTLPVSVVSGSIAALSGLIVNVSGEPVSVSGDQVNFASGVTLNLSGLNVVSTPIPAFQSGTLVGISGGSIGISGTAVTLSGIFSLSNISGGVTVSGLVGISGGAAGLSGLIVTASGESVQILASGSVQLAALSGIVTRQSGNVVSGAYVLPIPILMWDYSGQVWTMPSVDLSGGLNMRVAISQATTVAGVRAQNADNAGSTNALATQAMTYLLNAAGNFDRARTVLGSSGVNIGVLATAPAPWTYSRVTAAGVTNIFQSGPVLLHAVNINDYSSGLSFRVRDSQSGAAGTIVGNIQPFAGGLTVTDIPPVSLPYDAVFVTGLVVDTSGSGWDLTVLYRNLTS